MIKKNKGSIPADLLGRYRTELMGLAIIFVMVCHNTLKFGDATSKALSPLWQFCQIGVDMFLFMSGFGVYHSLSKDENVFRFYKKRFSRIIIPYVLVLILWGIAQLIHNTTNGVKGFVYSYSLITFYLRGELSSWYVAAIIPLYLVSPWLMKYFNRKKNALPVAILFVLGISFLMIAAAQIFHDTKEGIAAAIVAEVMVIRIPAFLGGMYFANSVQQKKITAINTKWLGIVLSVGVALFLLNTVVFPGRKFVVSQWYISRALFGLICFPLLILLGCLVGRLRKCKVFMISLGWLGTITFELYLLHEKILSYLDTLIQGGKITAVITNVLAVAVSLAVAIFIRKMTKSLLKLVDRSREKIEKIQM